jgi:hypothetical protein
VCVRGGHSSLFQPRRGYWIYIHRHRTPPAPLLQCAALIDDYRIAKVCPCSNVSSCLSVVFCILFNAQLLFCAHVTPCCVLACVVFVHVQVSAIAALLNPCAPVKATGETSQLGLSDETYALFAHLHDVELAAQHLTLYAEEV